MLRKFNSRQTCVHMWELGIAHNQPRTLRTAYMTRDPGFDPDWWEFDASERPVPLTGQPSENQGSGFEIADEAESIVRAARDDLAREDTDPTGWATDWRRSHRAGGGVGMSRLAAALLALACAGTFSLGWIQGIPAREAVPSRVQKTSPDQGRADVKSTTGRRERSGSTGERRLIRRDGAAKEVRTR